MLYAVEWLRGLCPISASDAALADALTARGLTVDSVESGSDGTVLDVDIPANRPDCLGHVGLARELAAAFGVALAERPAPPASVAAADWVRVEIEDARLCERYTAGLAREVRVGPSPAWVVRRLGACGLRSINNVVDASNLVLLELGQPVHFFDFDRLRGGAAAAEIGVRRARKAERLATLDGVMRELDAETLVIAGAGRPVALAGVIGGAATEIHGGTRQVLIEAAHFARGAIRGTARRLGLRTDASLRFERGVDARSIPAAQALALELLVELAQARPEPAIVDVHPAAAAARELCLSTAEVRRLLGYAPERDELLRALAAVGLEPRIEVEGRVRVHIPSWRPDLEREVDLVEEVARHIGYDQIPAALELPATASGSGPAPRLEQKACVVLAHRGFHEAIGYAMIAAGEDAPFVAEATPAALALTNPIAEPLAELRRSILPGLLRAADLNHRRGSADVRLFEVGRVFVTRPDRAPREPARIGIVWSGAAAPLHWSTPARPVDLFDLMGVVEQLLHALAPQRSAERRAGTPPGFHPGQSAVWTDSAGRPLAWGGALHPSLAERFAHPIFAAELEIEALAESASAAAQYRGIPRYPSVSRDLSLVLASDVAYEGLIRALRSIEPPAPVDFAAIDRYRGTPLGARETAVTVRFTLRPTDRTLTDAEAESYRAALLDRLARDLGVRLRA